MELRPEKRRESFTTENDTRGAPSFGQTLTENGKKAAPVSSKLAQWPCKLGLAPENAPYFDGADILLAADCTAYAYAGFHTDFMKNRITLVACPRLGAVDVYERLLAILRNNKIGSLTLVRMEVGCCDALEKAARRAILDSGSAVRLEVVTVGTCGRILEGIV